MLPQLHSRGRAGPTCTRTSCMIWQLAIAFYVAVICQVAESGGSCIQERAEGLVFKREHGSCIQERAAT